MESKRVLFLFSLLILGLVSDAKRHTSDYEPIKDPKDPYVVEMAKFAVREHDKTKSSNLVLVKVVSGEYHVISDEKHAEIGKEYRLNIYARIPNTRCFNGDMYEVVVHDEPSTKYRSLTSFEKVYPVTCY